MTGPQERSGETKVSADGMTENQNDPGTIREEAVNTILAELLHAHGIEASAEIRGPGGTPDIRVEVTPGNTVLLECKWDGASSQLESQLTERLETFPNALGLIGVLYPARLRHKRYIRANLKQAADLKWWLHGSRGESNPDRRIRTGSVEDLASHLRALPLDIEGMDAVQAAAKVVGHALEEAAKHISNHSRTAHDIADIIAKSDQEKDRAAALRIACLVLFNAIAFQDRLADVNENVPLALKSWRTKGIAGLRDAWNDVCENIDYVPVFELAANILDEIDYVPSHAHKPIIAPLIEATRETRYLQGHDLSGRLFHTLLTDAKFTGAYYTSIPAATMLARLVFHDWPPQIDWKDHEFPASLDVADLACGTGTLLMAVASEVERRHIEAGGRDAAELHKAMVEQALHGYDVQLSAVHFAATSLAMLNPNIQFDRMNLYVMQLGAEGANVSLGSLDFLGNGEAGVQYGLSPDEMGAGTRDAKRVSGNGPRGAEDGVTATLPDIDLAIMNPPFTRSSLMFGSLPVEDRRKIQSELARRLKSMQASAKAGMGAAFVAAAAPKLRPGEGRLALVLPLTVCTGRSWQQTRALIECEFALDIVIASHDPERWNFSDSTDLSEALLIATRRHHNGPQTEHRTTFVNLWQSPTNVLDAHRIAQAAARKSPADLESTGTALLEVDGRHVGEVLSIPESKLAGRKWVGVQFARADVTRSAMRLLDDGEVWVPGTAQTAKVPVLPLGELGEVGPDRRALINGFDRTNSVTAYPMIEGHDTEKRKSLTCSPDAYLAPLAEPKGGMKPGYGERLWLQASRLLVAERLWLETARVVSMWSERKVLSNVWWEIRIDEDEQRDKALAVWLNSSLGLLTYLARRTSTRGGWVGMKKGDLQELPVLDLRRLSQEQIQGLSDVFDRLVDAEFERLPGMSDCAARRALDDGLSKIMGLPRLDGLRALLATEPVVSNRRL